LRIPKPPATASRTARRSFLAASLAAIALAGGAQPRPRLDAAAATNLAIRLPMLAERITKLYAQVGQDVLAARSQRALAEAAREFDAGLRALVSHAETPEVRENYQLLQQLWDGFRPIALARPSVEDAKTLAERDEELAWIATKGARLFEARSPARQGALIRSAGEVRMLAQRIAKLHLLARWGVRPEASAAGLKAADNEYQLAMALLRSAPQNTPEIAAELLLADNQYLFLRQAAARVRPGRDARQELEFIAKTSDNIVEVMDRVARIYEAAGT